MSEGYGKGSHTIYDIRYHFVWVTKYRYHYASIGKLTENMIAAYIEQQEQAPSKDVFKVSDEWSALAKITDFQPVLVSVHPLMNF